MEAPTPPAEPTAPEAYTAPPPTEPAMAAPPGEVPPGEPLPIPQEGPRPHLTFFQQPWVQDLLPFATSLAIHLSLILVGVLTYQAVKQVSQVVKEQIIIPDSNMSTGDPGGIPNPGLRTDLDKAAKQDKETSVTESDGFSDAQNDRIKPALANAGGEETEQALLGPGALAAGHGKGSSLSGDASDPGGKLAAFGAPGGGGGIGPKGKVFGHGGNAMNIVYICDASGSMLGAKMDVLRQELENSVKDLQPVQGFDVVFFQDASGSDNKQPYIAFSNALVLAKSKVKQDLWGFLNDRIYPRGTTNPLPALDFAFHQPTKPDLIYLLTDGDFDSPGNAEVLKKIQDLEKMTPIKINPILLTAKREEIDAPENQAIKKVMQQIADQTGGNMTAVAADDL